MGSRTGKRISPTAATVAALCVLWAVALASPARAEDGAATCSCGRTTPRHDLDRADAAFTGRMAPEGGTAAGSFRYRVERRFKGDQPAVGSIVEVRPDPSCGGARPPAGHGVLAVRGADGSWDALSCRPSLSLLQLEALTGIGPEVSARGPPAVVVAGWLGDADLAIVDRDGSLTGTVAAGIDARLVASCPGGHRFAALGPVVERDPPGSPDAAGGDRGNDGNDGNDGNGRNDRGGEDRDRLGGEADRADGPPTAVVIVDVDSRSVVRRVALPPPVDATVLVCPDPDGGRVAYLEPQTGFSESSRTGRVTVVEGDRIRPVYASGARRLFWDRRTDEMLVFTSTSYPELVRMRPGDPSMQAVNPRLSDDNTDVAVDPEARTLATIRPARPGPGTELTIRPLRADGSPTRILLEWAPGQLQWSDPDHLLVRGHDHLLVFLGDGTRLADLPTRSDALVMADNGVLTVDFDDDLGVQVLHRRALDGSEVARGPAGIVVEALVSLDSGPRAGVGADIGLTPAPGGPSGPSPAADAAAPAREAGRPARTGSDATATGGSLSWPGLILAGVVAAGMLTALGITGRRRDRFDEDPDGRRIGPVAANGRRVPVRPDAVDDDVEVLDLLEPLDE